MSDSGLGAYASLLRIPHAARSAITGVVGQFPFPFPLLGMGLLIGIRDGYGSYTPAGTVSAVMAVTSAFTGPVVGRLIDTRCQRHVCLPLSAFWIAAIGFMSAAMSLHWPAWAMIVGAVLLGTAVPYSSMLRGRWTYALRERPGSLNSTLSLTSTLEELMWVIGNPLGTVLATSVAILSPMAGAVVAILIATWGFLLNDTLEPPAVPSAPTHATGARPEPAPPTTVTSAPTRTTRDRAAREPLLSLGFVSLLAIQVAYGTFVASTSISVVALTTELGMAGRAGFVIACFSAASMLGAIGYGARSWSSPLWTRFYVGVVIVAVGSSLLLLSHSLTAAALTLAVAGLAQAPTVVNVNQFLWVRAAGRPAAES